MIVRARSCASFALAGSLVGFFGVPVFAEAQTNPAQSTAFGQTPSSGDGAQGSAPIVFAENAQSPREVAPPGTPSASRVAIARRLVDAAGAFDGYMRRSAAIKANFSDGASVAHAVRVGSTFQAEQIEEGAIAYAALVALQDPDFVEEVQQAAPTPSARSQLAQRILQQPESVLNTPAARQEITRMTAVLGRMGLQLVAAGAAVKQSAYDIQRQDWSKEPIVKPEERLAQIKADSASPVTLAPADTAHLLSGLTSLREVSEEAQQADTASPVAMRGLALAALAILGRAGDDQVQAIAPLLTVAIDALCIKMARLNDNQCLAVAGPQYEDIFCLGRHAMMETGQCVAAAAGLRSDEVRVAMDTTSVFIPVGLASSSVDGPERQSVYSHASGMKGNNVDVPSAGLTPTVATYSPYTGP